MSISFIPSINSLRAIAVLSVVLCHFQVPGWEGGFVGVDIFFVISGFLMHEIITHQIKEGNFSFPQFYMQRLRRIAPASLATICVTLLVSSLILLPLDFRQLAQSIISTLTLSANIHFYNQLDYFDARTFNRPLLHMWSLAVEAQFYVFFPIFVYLLLRLRVGTLTLAYISVGIIGLILAQYAIYRNPESAFYLLPYRGWEFLLGALAATLPALPQSRFILRDLTTIIGIALIALSIGLLDKTTPFPGLSAFPACLGTALVLLSRTGAPTLLQKLLNIPPISALGYISFSLYLWHWPLIALAQTYSVYTLDSTARVTLFLISLVAAALSWAYLEEPIRKRTIFSTNRILLATIFIATALLLVSSIAIKSSRGWPERLSSEVVRLDSYTSSKNPRQQECLKILIGGRTPPALNPDTACTYGNQNISPTWALWGNSHADTIIEGLGQIAQKYDQSIRFFGVTGCKPILEIDHNDPRIGRACSNFSADSMRVIVSDKNITNVILMGGGYQIYYHSHIPALGPELPAQNNVSPILSSSGNPFDSLADAEAYMRRNLFSTVNQLLQLEKRVFIVYPHPDTGYDIPRVLAQLARRNEDPEDFTNPAGPFFKYQQGTFDLLDSLPKSPNLIRIYPHRHLCDLDSCMVIKNGKPLYRDSTHLSLAGAELIISDFEEYFSNVSNGHNTTLQHSKPAVPTAITAPNPTRTSPVPAPTIQEPSQ